MLVVDTDPRRVEAQLVAGRLACPGCGGRLSRWGFTALRTVRMRDGEHSMRLRRGCCRRCGVTHVLLPASLTARRRDGVEVIGDALHRAALGEGHRRIAERLGRPPDTVRGWLRAARQAAAPVRACAARWFVALDVESGPVQPQRSVIADAVEALMLRPHDGADRVGRRLGDHEGIEHGWCSFTGQSRVICRARWSPGGGDVAWRSAPPPAPGGIAQATRSDGLSSRTHEA
jgi:hypothetical protein